MKLLTLNTHSLEETDYESKLLAFAGGIWKEQPDIIALQEVNQTQTSSPVDLQTLKQCGYVPCMPRHPLPVDLVRGKNRLRQI